MNKVTEIWIINGIPGSGKTTTARVLAQKLPQAAHIEGDVVQDFIVSGKVSPGQEPHAEESRQIHLCVANQCILAKSFSEAGFTPVVDYIVVNQERIEEYKSYLPGYQIYLVTLNPGIEKALERDKNRTEKTVAHLWTHLDAEIKKDLIKTGLWVDNKNLKVSDVVEFILTNKETARVA